MTTARTQLRRREPTPNQDEVSVTPSGFIFDLPQGLTMRRVCNRLGKLGFRHAFQVQRLARDRAVHFDDRSGKLMSEVSATVSNLLVLTSQRASGFGPVCATFLATRKSARGPLDLTLSLPEEARVFGDATIGVSGETIKANINTNCCFRLDSGLGQIRQVEFSDQRDMPFACRVTLERSALQGQINRLRLPDSYPADFRNIDAATFKLYSLRNSERLMGTVFLLESGEVGPLLKEVIKRPLAIGEGLLQQLRIDVLQPLEARLVFQSGQFGRKLGPGDGLASLLVGLFSTMKRPVKDESARPRITRERRLLFGRRIDPELVDLSFQHPISSALQVDVFANRSLFSPNRVIGLLAESHRSDLRRIRCTQKTRCLIEATGGHRRRGSAALRLHTAPNSSPYWK